MFESKMRTKQILFLLWVFILYIVQCSTKYAPKPYYAGLSRQISSHDILVEKMKKEIRNFYGAPYKWGGDSPRGTDCSGMIKTIYKNTIGIHLPHNAEEIYKTTKKIYKIDLTFGDLVFFSNNGKSATHMGLYISKGYFLHASSTRGVMLSKLSDLHYRKQFIGARRIEIY